MSFEFEISAKDEAGAEFVVKLGKALQRALVERKGQGKITQQEIASKLGVDRGRVNRCFSGYANLTAESIGELAWALGASPEIVFKFEPVHAPNVVHVTDFQRPQRNTVTAQKVATIGLSGESTHVWRLADVNSKYYRLHSPEMEPFEPVSTPATREILGNWELIGRDG